jgi:hypothetical protein
MRAFGDCLKVIGPPALGLELPFGGTHALLGTLRRLLERAARGREGSIRGGPGVLELLAGACEGVIDRTAESLLQVSGRRQQLVKLTLEGIRLRVDGLSNLKQALS